MCQQILCKGQLHAAESCPGKRSIQNVREILIYDYKKFSDTILDSILQLTFKKLPLVEFWFSFKEDYPQLSEKLLLPSPTNL